jgi:hypothetical protein
MTLTLSLSEVPRSVGDAAQLSWAVSSMRPVRGVSLKITLPEGLSTVSAAELSATFDVPSTKQTAGQVERSLQLILVKVGAWKIEARVWASTPQGLLLDADQIFFDTSTGWISDNPQRSSERIELRPSPTMRPRLPPPDQNLIQPPLRGGVSLPQGPGSLTVIGNFLTWISENQIGYGWARADVPTFLVSGCVLVHSYPSGSLIGVAQTDSFGDFSVNVENPYPGGLEVFVQPGCLYYYGAHVMWPGGWEYQAYGGLYYPGPSEQILNIGSHITPDETISPEYAGAFRIYESLVNDAYNRGAGSFVANYMGTGWSWIGTVDVFFPESGSGAWYDGDIHIADMDFSKALDIAQHEYAHYIMDIAGRFPPGPGDCPSPHYLSYVSGVQCGWTEGWADYFPLVAQSFGNTEGLQDPVFEWGDGSWLDLEWATWGNWWSNGPFVEGRVAGALWDFYDSWQMNDGYDTYQSPDCAGYPCNDPYDIWDTFVYATYGSFSDFWDSWKSLGRDQSQEGGTVAALYQNTIEFWPVLQYARISGNVAADTAGIAALKYWGPYDPYRGYVGTVYLAHLGGLNYGEEFHVVDALTAGSSVGNSWMSFPQNGPVLLVPGNLDTSWKQIELDRTINYLWALWPDNVVFLGSTGSISLQVEQYVRDNYWTYASYDRVSGTVAADTAGLLALRAYPGGSSTVYIGHLGGFTAADEFHIVDALTAGASVGNSAPVLLVPGSMGPEAWKKVEVDTTIYYLGVLGASDVVILGSIGSITQEVEDYLKANYPSATYSRISGTIAADTAGMCALMAYPDGAFTVYLAHLGGLTSSEEFHVVDALTAGSSVGNSGPVLLVPGNLDVPWKQAELDRTIYYLNQLHASQLIFLGSTGSISKQVEDYVRAHYTPSAQHGPPSLDLYAPEINGLSVTINGLALPGTPGTSISRIHWIWGDQTSEDAWFPATHTYLVEGTYTILATAFQSDGQSTTRTVQVYVYPAATSNWLTQPVTLDGHMTTPDEWSDAASYYLPLPNYYGPGIVSATFWFKNDATWLYILERVEWSPGAGPQECDSSSIEYFWPEWHYPNGWDYSDAGGVNYGGLYPNPTFDLYGWDEQQWYDDTLAVPPGQNNVQGAATHDGTGYWFEFRKPLASGDGYDWTFVPGGTYGPRPPDLMVGFSHQTQTTFSFYGTHILLHLQAGLTSNWLANPVTLDGKMTTQQEWSEALPPAGQDMILLDQSRNEVKATFWMKNDATWLYVLARVERPGGADANDAAYIDYFWDQWPYGDGSGTTYAGPPTDAWWNVDVNNFVLDTDATPPGQNNVEGAATYDGTYYWFEFRKALNSGDGYDWAFVPGGTYGTMPSELDVGFWDNSQGAWYSTRILLHLETASGPASSQAPSLLRLPLEVGIAWALLESDRTGRVRIYHLRQAAA